MILDLSFDIAVNGVRLGSVNNNSNKKLAPQHAMFELGNVIPRLVWALATARRDVPVLFSKINLKDGYWRMCVSADDAWNFAYVLPKLDENKPTVLVVPDALQMGWSESPPFSALRQRPLGMSLSKHSTTLRKSRNNRSNTSFWTPSRVNFFQTQIN